MNDTTFLEAAARAVNISDLLSLLSIGFHNPTRELASGILDGSFYQDLNNCCTALNLSLSSTTVISFDSYIQKQLHSFSNYSAAADALYHEINQEYTRLFLAPWNEQVALCEGSFLHGRKTAQFTNPSALHAEQCYRHNQYLFDKKGLLPGDHISVELSYLAFLFTNLGIAHQAQRNDQVKLFSDAILDFYEKHLMRWLNDFAQTLSKTTTHSFFHMLAETAARLNEFILLHRQW